ncbi:MAG: beta-galactosidase [Chthoniobacterales bacterium]|nr:beta-galactosidase [Chthoniobacterales bacterium]
MRCSFGWDDYEPKHGQYDFDWLKQFVALANSYGIKLRPYVGYTAPWAGVHGSDGIYWNDRPENENDSYNFVYHLASALKAYPNVLSMSSTMRRMTHSGGKGMPNNMVRL